ncbi:methylated-DNA--[protein]-cysteine S-methyltransferase [Sphingobacterium olei]|uniref:methylated-DNA--[protein]-cysteine S-methyltransferase n=1 Tax=Sphingobacterium olei TaxID=2571155 RepID=A0A4U0PF59_9SPHI|nr:methylated-DNA--[protein]-cysteine S-methyltransferase [Sphingobacterium olei]TJZ61384.1 methylated-DNA--[protein]-cysteine S-methyltransferase [Sphingobacterium olei]
MTITQQHINYERIAKAIAYIQHNFRHQPSLEELAAHVHISPFHFQRLFTEWAGTSPKKFLQYISVSYAKSLLENQKHTIFETVYETGLTSSSRLHDLFIQIEGMTPAEYKNGGQNLTIYYSFSFTPFGESLIASTEKGICYMAFVEDATQGFYDLQKKFPDATYIKKEIDIHCEVNGIFNRENANLPQLKLHLKGTPFQLKVWEALLKIPMGSLSTYGTIAKQINHEKASRAVGTAIGSNPIAYLIPCHRVIQSSGIFGGYMWNPTRKAAIIGWENAQLNPEQDETI